MQIRSRTRGIDAALAASLATLIFGGHSMAEPIVVMNDGMYRDVVVSNLDYYIPCLQPDLELVPYGDLVISLNSITMNFAYDTGGELGGGIGGNALPPFPARPLQTPAIYIPGGLHIEGMTVGSPSDFVKPSYDPFLGDTLPAFITHGTGPFSAFNLLTFQDGDMAYIGYASSDFAQFGYMQIQRVNVTDWTLIGYAYDSRPITVIPLPTPPTGALFGAALAAIGSRSRRPGRA
jgi:hypothetical protein